LDVNGSVVNGNNVKQNLGIFLAVAGASH